MPVGDELEADLGQPAGVFGLDLSMDRPNPSSVFLRPETGELIRCMSSRVLELAVHDPVRFLESHPSVVVGEINHLLADTEVWVSACGTLNVDGRQL